MLDVGSAQFRRTVAQAGKKATLSYTELSGMGPWTMPESWLQNAMADHLRKHFFVMVEARTRDIETWSEDKSRREPGKEPPLVRDGRIDIVLFNKNVPDPSMAETVGLIEVKKYAGRNHCNEDAERLRGLAQKIGLHRGSLMVAYLQEASEDKLGRGVKGLLREVAADERHHCERFLAPAQSSRDRHCAILVVEIEPDAVEREKLLALRKAIEAGLQSGIAADFSFATLNRNLDAEWARTKARESAD